MASSRTTNTTSQNVSASPLKQGVSLFVGILAGFICAIGIQLAFMGGTTSQLMDRYAIETMSNRILDEQRGNTNSEYAASAKNIVNSRVGEPSATSLETSFSGSPLQLRDLFTSDPNSHPHCVTKFIKYEPSLFESEWQKDATMDVVNRRGLCELFISAKFKKWSETYMRDDETHKLVLHHPPHDLPTCSRRLDSEALDREVYSSFEYERVCPEGAPDYGDMVNGGIVIDDREETVVFPEAEVASVMRRWRASSSLGGVDDIGEGCGVVCGGRAEGISFEENFETILARTDAMSSSHRSSLMNESASRSKRVSADDDSRRSLKVRRTRFQTLIEPLVGLLREPRLCQVASKRGKLEKKKHIKYNILVKCWLAIDPLATFTNNSFPSKRFFFDLGASSWSAGAGGASQSWFYHTYRTYCAEFNEIYAWEMTQLDASIFFAEIPDHLKPGYHYFNHAMTPEWGSWDNPLTHILQRAQPDDFVVIKIDIDTGSVEGALIDEIIANKEISDRIDELFFEHHVWMELLDEAWKTTIDKTRTYVDSLRLFTNLRKRGIRAHSWV